MKEQCDTCKRFTSERASSSHGQKQSKPKVCPNSQITTCTTVWPSGPRRWTQVPLSSGAWVRTPPLSFQICELSSSILFRIKCLLWPRRYCPALFATTARMTVAVCDGGTRARCLLGYVRLRGDWGNALLGPRGVLPAQARKPYRADRVESCLLSFARAALLPDCVCDIGALDR